MIVKIMITLLPVIAFLLMLNYLDTYKLLSKNLILKSFLYGSISALIAFLINQFTVNYIQITHDLLSAYVAPAIEETLKIIPLVLLVRKNRLGFLVDAAIIGFAVGSGFAFSENVYYLLNLNGSNITVWIFRGFGTAIMHGSTTAIFGMIFIFLEERKPDQLFPHLLYSLAVAFAIHSFFNHFFLPPIINIILQLILLPIIMMIVFTQSEKGLKKWLQTGFDSEIEILASLKSGHFQSTKQGRYLIRFKKQFSAEIMLDIFCYLRVYLELSIRSKGILMMKENGVKVEVEQEIKDKFNELTYLEENIGKTGRSTIMPLLNRSKKDLWQIYFLERNS